MSPFFPSTHALRLEFVVLGDLPRPPRVFFSSTTENENSQSPPALVNFHSCTVDRISSSPKSSGNIYAKRSVSTFSHAHPSLPSHLEKRQVAPYEVWLMMREKLQHAPAPRDCLLTRPEQRAMIRVVHDEVREQYKVELGVGLGRLDSTAPYVPAPGNTRVSSVAHDVLRDGLHHIIHVREVGGSPLPRQTVRAPLLAMTSPGKPAPAPSSSTLSPR